MYYLLRPLTCAGAVFAWLFLVNWAVASEPTLESQVDQLFSKWNRPDVPGCAVGIVRDGTLIYAKGFGSAQLDYEAPNTPETIFEVGSAAKSFTCACIALLLDRKQISVDDDVRKYVPELHGHDPPIRIRDLISCRSGIWDQWHLAQLVGWSSEPIQTPYSDADLLALLAGQKTLPFEPGTQFAYSSSDYFLLGLVVRRVTSKTLAEFARENLFKRLGMSRTYFEEDPTRIVKNRAVGYDGNIHDRETPWQSWTTQANGSGGCNLKSCVTDLVRWDQNFVNNRLGGGHYFQTFLSEGTLLDNRNVLDATPTGRYRGLKRIQFTGGVPGYSAAITRFPEQKFTVICLSNSDISPWDMSKKIADIYLAEKLEPLAKNTQNVRRQEEHTVTPADELRDMTGAYRAPDRRIWRCSFKDGKLWMTDHLNNAFVLHPLSTGRFHIDPFPKSTLVFKRPAVGAHFELTVESPDGTMTLDRVELTTPSALTLEDYVGEYRSSELAVTYTFDIKSKGLWVRIGSRGPEQLDATVADEFVPHIRRAFDNRIFTFQRNGSNKVVGLNVALWRIEGVRFEKH
jgi:CubicO group peptidase (beta-lactamase class C family)